MDFIGIDAEGNMARMISRTLAGAGAMLAAPGGTVYAATYDWTLGGVDNGMGILTTGAADGGAGGVDITAFSGSIDGLPVSLVGGDPGVGSVLGNLDYDNLLYPAANGIGVSSGGSLLDSHGVIFSYDSETAAIYADGGADTVSSTTTIANLTSSATRLLFRPSPNLPPGW
jgi:hypothetical protein